MPYLYQRKALGEAIGDFQGMQFQYAEAAMEIEAARVLTYNAARLKEQGKSFVMEAAMAKLYASKVAELSSSKCIEWVGDPHHDGLINPCGLMWKYLNPGKCHGFCTRH